jgi:hypothetical protein
MRRVLLSALATAAIALSTTPAQAATILNATCSGNCFTGLDIVNLTSATNTSLGVGTVDGITINFTSSTDALDLANGAATVSTHDGSGFGQLTFKLLDGAGFSQADFALDQASKPITLDFLLSDGTHQSYTITNPTGSEPFGIQADAGTYITQVSITTTDGSYNTFKQLKLGGFNSTRVPEPSTWALMLLGFGGIGMTLRRSRRRNKPALMQIA